MMAHLQAHDSIGLPSLGCAVARGVVPSDLKTTSMNRSTHSPVPGSRLSRFPAIMSLETRDSRDEPGDVPRGRQTGLDVNQGLPHQRAIPVQPAAPGRCQVPE